MSDKILWGTHTTIPWREWNLFDTRISRRLCSLHTVGQLTWDAGGAKSDWDDTHIPYGIIGRDIRSPIRDGWYTIFKPMAEDFQHYEESLGTLHTVGFRAIVGIKERLGAKGLTHFSTRCTFHQEPNAIDWNKVTGQYYDGVNEWDSYYPPYYSEYTGLTKIGESATNVYIADLTLEYQAYINAKAASGHITFNQFTAEIVNIGHLFRNGLNIQGATFFNIAYGDAEWFTVRPTAVRILYLNGMVNSLSQRKMQAAGGISLQLSGRGFRIPEADLECYTYSTAGTWDHHVEHIYFIGREGQGTYQLNWNLGGINRDFDQTNDLISIFSMPAMAPGTYHIRLGQEDDQHGNNNTYFFYAGDWRANDQGRGRPGSRHVFVVYDTKIPVDPPSPFFEWGWKWGDLEIKEHYAPLDTRATATFWDGRVLSLSSLTRSIDDKTGLFNISDVNVELANQDKHFSQLLANYFCKGQIAQIAHGRGEEPEAWHETIFFAMVDDYNLRGPGFNAKLKDYAQKYLKGQQPRYIITREEYPDCKEAADGQPIQELVGRHYFAAGSAPGAIQAHCTDENNFIYICARGPLHAILNVYADGTAINPANYVAFIDAAGRQYVQFDGDQEDKKITFNCEGYMFGFWDSANGYIQNPAYVIAFYWAMLLEIPIDFIDLDAIDAMATVFDDAGLGEIGKLFVVALEEKGAVLQKLLFSFGIKYWQTKEGLLTIGRKDIASLATSIFIHAQIEVQDIPDRAYNLESAVNLVKAYYNRFPAADLFEGSIEEGDASSIAQFGSEMSSSEPWEYPFITSGDFCEQRVLEDLLKFAYGDKYVTFQLPLEMIGDIDIFDNFQLQDPYGLSATGEGEIGRYYYITSLTYDYQNSTIGVVAIDLQWLLQQYFIFGDEDTMPDLWEDASEFFRYYGYCCDEDTGEFAGGFRGKVLIDENLLEQE